MVNDCKHHRRDDEDQVLDMYNEIEDSGNTRLKVKNESEAEAAAVAEAYAKAFAKVFQNVKFED